VVNINLVSAIATAASAMFTAYMAYSTQQMARATRDSVEHEEDAIEQYKDNLMPVLTVDGEVQFPENSGGPHRLLLTISNKGAGPAFMTEVSVREDLSISDLYRHPLRHTVLGANTMIEYDIPGSDQYTISDNTVSSLSLWYRDVYDRWYRSRIVFQYPQRVQGDQRGALRVLVREFKPHIEPVKFSYGELHNPCPPNHVGRFEYGRPVPQDMNNISPIWHSLDAHSQMHHLTVKGAAITNLNPVTVIDFGFWWELPFPEFILQVSGFPPFVLGLRKRDSKSEAIILPLKDYDAFQCVTFMKPPLVPNSHAAPLEQWGLNNTNRAAEQLVELYTTVFKQLNHHLNPMDSLSQEDSS